MGNRLRIAVAVTLPLLALVAAGQELASSATLQEAGPWQQARAHFERAQRADASHEHRRQWLEQSLSAYPTYRAAYELGKLHRQTAAPTLALTRFQEAFELTDQDEYLARAAYQLGITHRYLDRHTEARRWLRRSLSFSDHDAVRGALRDLELSRRDQLVTAGEILEELRVERTFGVAKAELRVHFELNRARLDPRGHQQTVELGKALSDRRWRDETFYLLGHTDRLCPRDRPDFEACDHHNLGLSERRATTVHQVLTRELGLAPERLRVVACGRQHPLSHQTSADDHYLNRRVVVMATDGSPASGQDHLCRHDAGLL